VVVLLDRCEEETIRALEGFAQSALWCITPAQADLATLLLKPIEAKFPWFREQAQLVWLLPGEKPTPPYSPELLSLVHRDFKLTFDAPRPNQGPLLSKGFERIIHSLRGVQIGIALGGG